MRFAFVQPDPACMMSICSASQKLWSLTRPLAASSHSLAGTLSHPSLASLLQALVFVRDLDSGLLSQCPTAAGHFDVLRRATDRLVNSVLQLRQLLQRRRGPNPGDTPRPLPRNDSLSSFTESTTSGETRPSGMTRQQGCWSEQPVLSAWQLTAVWRQGSRLLARLQL